MRSSSTMMRSFIMLRYLGALFKAKHPGTCRSSGVPWEDPIVRPVVWSTVQISHSNHSDQKSENMSVWRIRPLLCQVKNINACCFDFVFWGKVLSCFKTLETSTVVMNVCNDSVAWWVESRWGAHSAGCQGSSPDCYLVPGRNFIKWEFVDCVRQERFILNWHAGYKLTDTH